MTAQIPVKNASQHPKTHQENRYTAVILTRLISQSWLLFASSVRSATSPHVSFCHGGEFQAATSITTQYSQQVQLFLSQQKTAAAFFIGPTPINYTRAVHTLRRWQFNLYPTAFPQ